MDIEIPVKKEGVSKAILRLLSTFQNFSNYEINLMTTMLNNNIKSLDTPSRKKVRTLMNSDQYTFNNYVSKMIKSGALFKGSNGLEIHPSIVQIVKDQKLSISFKILEPVV